MQNQQLDLFEDNAVNATDEYDDGYQLDVSLAFTRIDERGIETGAAISMGEAADNLDDLLPVMLDFLHYLGFDWVASLQATADNGKVFKTP
jgi:hypothetical protein